MNSYSTSWWSLLLINRPREDERLSWPCWLTYTGRLTHKVIIRPASSQAQDRYKFAGQRPAFYHCATPPGSLLVNRLCTFSTASMSCLRCGDHIYELYSKIGLTYAINALTYGQCDANVILSYLCILWFLLFLIKSNQIKPESWQTRCHSPVPTR